MAENKKGFVLYADLIHTVRKLKPKDAGELLLHILQYVNDENPVTKNSIVDLSFEPIKQQLKRDLKKYEDSKVRKSEGGKKGMQNRWKQGDPISTDNIVITKDNIVKEVITPITVTVTDTVTVKDNVKVTIENSNTPLPAIYFRIGKDVIREKVSDYFKKNNEIFLNNWFYQNKDPIAPEVYERFDTDYLGYEFSHNNHLQNTFKQVWRNILKEKSNGKFTSREQQAANLDSFIDRHKQNLID